MIQSITPSCINEVMNCKKSVMPQKGMLGTMFVGSDRYAVLCTEIISPKQVRIVTHIDDSDLANSVIIKDGVQYVDDKTLVHFVTNAGPKYERYAKLYGDTEEVKEMYDWDYERWDSETRYTLRKNGRWMPKGTGQWGTSSIHWGYADNYLDPSF